MEYVRLDGFADRPNLVHLQEHRIARLLFVRHLDSIDISDKEIIADQLVRTCRMELCPARPVVLGEWIFQQCDGILVKNAPVELHHLVWGLAIGRLCLEAKVIVAVLEKFGRRRIDGIPDHPCVPTQFNSFTQ